MRASIAQRAARRSPRRARSGTLARWTTNLSRPPASATAIRSSPCCARISPTARACSKSAAAPASTRCISPRRCRIWSGRRPIVAENLPGIRAWLAEAKLCRTRRRRSSSTSPTATWPTTRFDAIFSANTLHIMSWPEVETLFARAAGDRDARREARDLRPVQLRRRVTPARATPRSTNR